MALTKIKQGLDLPISGVPDQSTVQNGKPVQTVALLGEDYVGMRPTIVAQVGDRVKLGDVLFTDKKMEGVLYTSPGAGEVISINRGIKRAFLSMVIRLEGNDEITFASHREDEIDNLDRETVKEQLIASGQWTALRARPFSKVADPATEAQSIFVNAMDTKSPIPGHGACISRAGKKISHWVSKSSQNSWMGRFFSVETRNWICLKSMMTAYRSKNFPVPIPPDWSVHTSTS